jgi:uncharacterized protein (DUF983 family)
LIDTHARSARTKFVRAILLRCPRCGSGGIRRSWLKMKDRCPTCDLALERGEDHDYWLGAYAINLVIAEGIAAVAGLILLWRLWPNIAPGMWTGGALAIAMPILFYPFSRTIWLAWDLSFRPTEAGDDR